MKCKVAIFRQLAGSILKILT